ncbi:hypothetical protein LCGC14_0351320 [marine sediment metagenome]|uniref:Uncharacterized protein n=1 Tax=marine sediment metagenome TaxID=412755 RepID=A0A0F9WIN5_9ZZZZ
MKSEKQIKDFLKKCSDTPRSSNGMLADNCPIDGELGCCAECSFPSGLEWVLKSQSSKMKLPIDGWETTVSDYCDSHLKV